MILKLIKNREDLGSNCCTVLMPGKRGDKSKWDNSSIFFEEDTFGFLEDIIESIIPRFSHYAVTEISKTDWINIIDRFSILISELRTAKNISDIKSPLYFHFKNTEKEFLSDFQGNKTKLANMTEELCQWLTEKLEKEDVITIVGM